MSNDLKFELLSELKPKKWNDDQNQDMVSLSEMGDP